MLGIPQIKAHPPRPLFPCQDQNVAYFVITLAISHAPSTSSILFCVFVFVVRLNLKPAHLGYIIYIWYFQTIAIIRSRNLLLAPWWRGHHYHFLLKGRNGTSGIVSDQRAMFVYSHCGTYDYRVEKAVDHLHEDDHQYLQSKCSRLDKR